MKVLKVLFFSLSGLIIASCVGIVVCALNPSLTASFAKKVENMMSTGSDEADGSAESTGIQPLDSVASPVASPDGGGSGQTDDSPASVPSEIDSPGQAGEDSPASAGSPSDPGSPRQADRISAGTIYSTYVDDNGSLWTWGRGQDGELGNGKNGMDYREAMPVKVMENVVSVSACDGDDDGGMFTAAVQADGSLWMWGANNIGQLGFNGGNAEGGWGVDICQTVPVKVMDDVATVSCGLYDTAAVKTDGSLWVWGLLFSENGREEEPSAPVKIMDDVSSVSCSGICNAAIKTDGSLWTWGRFAGNGYQKNAEGELQSQTVPMKLMDDVARVSCGNGHVAVVKTDGSLWVWGTNGYGQLGLEGDDRTESGPVLADSISFQGVPVKVMEDVAFVACSYGNTAVIKTDGSLWTCGWNEYGQVGNGESGDDLILSAPVKVLDNVSSVSCSMSHMLAVKNDGTLWTWGGNIGGTIYDPEAGEENEILPFPTEVIISR